MAVYTEVSDEELIAFISNYDIGDLLSFKGIAEGVENSNYMLHTNKGVYILTLYEKRVNPDDLPFFLGLMDHLADKGISCPVPIKQNSGETLGVLANRPAVIVSFLEGMWIKRPSSQHCAALGSAVARLHLATADFNIGRPNALSLNDWRPLFEQSRNRADEINAGLEAEILTELGTLEANWPDDLPAGIIHADLFPDNVFFLEGKLSGLIDFYFACNDFWAYDLAICLNAWCYEPDFAFNVTKARALLNGYRRIRPLSAAEFEALPLLARGASLRFLLTRLHDWLRVPDGALVKPKDPMEYLKKLRFHQSVTNSTDYGLLP
ncbi:MAG: homoserine kinase [Stappiaceae bacterium]